MDFDVYIYKPISSLIDQLRLISSSSFTLFAQNFEKLVIRRQVIFTHHGFLQNAHLRQWYQIFFYPGRLRLFIMPRAQRWTPVFRP